MLVTMCSEWSAIAAALKTSGYMFIPQWRQAVQTLELAESLGDVVDVAAAMGTSVPAVQTLRPRRTSEAPPNLYSGTYGLDAFPFHTDLAHWSRPPRYFLLRCIHGSPSVPTTLLPRPAFEAVVGANMLKRAIVRPRRTGLGQALCAMPLEFAHESVTGIRWDPMFIVPMNKPAEHVAAAMRLEAWGRVKSVEILLVHPGDTLIVNNWFCLHGRGPVSNDDKDRYLERVYLSRVRE